MLYSTDNLILVEVILNFYYCLYRENKNEEINVIRWLRYGDRRDNIYGPLLNVFIFYYLVNKKET